MPALNSVPEFTFILTLKSKRQKLQEMLIKKPSTPQVMARLLQKSWMLLSFITQKTTISSILPKIPAVIAA